MYISYFISKFSFRINPLFGILALSCFVFYFVLFCLGLPELRQLLFLYYWNSKRTLCWFQEPLKAIRCVLQSSGLPEGRCVRRKVMCCISSYCFNANIITCHEAVHILRSVAFSYCEMIFYSSVVGNLREHLESQAQF